MCRIVAYNNKIVNHKSKLFLEFAPHLDEGALT